MVTGTKVTEFVSVTLLSSCGLRRDSIVSMSEELARLKERADELAAEGDLAGALLAFQSAVAVTPNDAVLHEAIAQIQSELDDHAAALTAAAKATELAPEVRV